MSPTTVNFDESTARQNVFGALLSARSRYGGSRKILHDADDKQYSYNDIIQASFGLGSALTRDAAPKEAMGLMLPTGAAAVISFFAINAYGRIPAMLNFTAGERNLKSACAAAQVKTIVTARKFIELGELQDLVAALEEDHKIVYLEDVREGLTLRDKAAGGLGPIMPWAFCSKPNHKSTAVILFTSGTEGDPKGVALSHFNLVSNARQILQHVPDVLTPEAVIYNPLPTFHCFGLMAGALLPLLGGMKTVLYPSPLHVKEIPSRIKASGANILFATDTFLSQYVRSSNSDDLKGLDYAVCGAERVKDETRQLVQRRCGIEIIEGYGVTETSPVLAVNQPAVGNRSGTVGRPLPGMELMFEPVTGINNAGRLKVKGPNVMRGYISLASPGVIEPLEEGWHDTGDVVGQDEDGFLTIRGRLKRFAKLGGEMVSLAVVENCAYAVWPDYEHAAAVLPDTRKGEQVVLLTTNPNADRSDLSHWIQNHGVSELSLPRKIFHVEEIPLLGTGKMDIGAVQKIAQELVEPKAEVSA